MQPRSMSQITRPRFTHHAGGVAGAALTLPLAAGLRLAAVAPAAADGGRAGAVYTLTNSAGGNAVAVFDRATDGTLNATGMVSTGGKGTGTGLGSQGALAMSKDGSWLYAVNPGSDTVAALRVTDRGPNGPSAVPSSGGQRPISLTAYGSLLYVLNEAGGTLAGFVVGSQGALAPLPNSITALPGGAPAGPAQVSFTPDGNALLVTQKAANALVSYAVGGDGRLGAPSTLTSSGATPFGFAFAGSSIAVVSEAKRRRLLLRGAAQRGRARHRAARFRTGSAPPAGWRRPRTDAWPTSPTPAAARSAPTRWTSAVSSPCSTRTG